MLISGWGRAKKRAECKLEEELVDRLDTVAELLKTNRTDIIRKKAKTLSFFSSIGEEGLSSRVCISFFMYRCIVNLSSYTVSYIKVNQEPTASSMR